MSQRSFHIPSSGPGSTIGGDAMSNPPVTAAHQVSLPAALARHAQLRPDAVAVAVYGNTQSTRDSSQLRLTYGELHARASNLAGSLLTRGEPGDRILLLFPTGLDFVVAFLGCMYAGMIPVPLPLPDGKSGTGMRVSGAARDCTAALGLTDSGHEAELKGWAAEQERDRLTVVAADRLPAAGGSQVMPSRHDGDAIAFLQYTSGSTERPRGVRVTMNSLQDNVHLIQQRLEVSDSTVFCSWLPFFHDMGLILMLLLPLHVGAQAVVMPSMRFLRRPVSWLNAISESRANVSAAPDFAYDLCTRRVTEEQLNALDLSCWRYAISGAEPVRPRTVAAFGERFARAGFDPNSLCPAYGLAEATLGVSVGSPDRAPGLALVRSGRIEPVIPSGEQQKDHNLRVVGCGAPFVDTLIVDPETGKPRPDGTIGEIWVRGPSIADGYWENEQKSEQAFKAVTADGESGFLRTGDLGAMKQGELYVTGRLKEVIVISGRNFYPHDIEQRAQEAHPALHGMVGCAFSVRSSSEEVVVVHEVDASELAPDGLGQIAAVLRRELSGYFGIPFRNIVLMRRGKVARTTSGKVQRLLMRQHFLTGRLDSLYEHIGHTVRRGGVGEPEGAGLAR